MNRWPKNCLECPMDDKAAPVRASCLKCGYYKKKPKPIPVPLPELGKAAEVVVILDGGGGSGFLPGPGPSAAVVAPEGNPEDERAEP